MSDPAHGQVPLGQRALTSDGVRSLSGATEPLAPPKQQLAPPKPQIGDTRPAAAVPTAPVAGTPALGPDGLPKRRRRRGGRGRGRSKTGTAGGANGTTTTATSGNNANAINENGAPVVAKASTTNNGNGTASPAKDKVQTAPKPKPAQQRAPRPKPQPRPEKVVAEASDETTAAASKNAPNRKRRTRERNGRPVGRYLMCVHVREEATQIAVLEGRSLIEHHVAWAKDDANQIDGNIYRGRVKNVLPGMEAAFVDIGTPKNAVLYWGDVSFDRGDDDAERDPSATRIEHLLRPGQTIVCQVTKNPIGLKGARLTEEVSLPGRFVVFVPNSTASGISKRLGDNERKRLRKILDDIRPDGHGVIIRTAAEGVSVDELRQDVEQLLEKWNEIEEKAKHEAAPTLLYSEPHLALRAIREEFTDEYRGVIVDDYELSELVRAYVSDIDPALADRVEYYDPAAENMPLFERHHVHEQLHKALDRKVWLPSGGSLIIERTEALTVIDVNTGKNVGTSSLEETVFRNNLEAAEEIARQLRLRDIGGIIVIDFIDMEIKANRQEVAMVLRTSLSRDKTPTQVFEISDLGLVEMTRKRVGEGLVEALSDTCPTCKGRGFVFSDELDA